MAGDIYLSEIFSGIQGEGHYAGYRQVFLRLTGCTLRCAYCDQPESLELRPGDCRIECTPGIRDFAHMESPIPVPEADKWVDALMASAPHHSVSVTGGEPLMQSGRLARLLPLLKEKGHRIHLETSGVLPQGLARVISWVDAISMDLKLSSADRQEIDLSVHRSFLDVALGSPHQPHVYAKAVIAAETSATELCAAIRMVASAGPDMEVFLQPVTPHGPVTAIPSPAHMLALQEAALRVHPHVRVLPQTHKQIGQL